MFIELLNFLFCNAFNCRLQCVSARWRHFLCTITQITVHVWRIGSNIISLKACSLYLVCVVCLLPRQQTRSCCRVDNPVVFRRCHSFACVSKSAHILLVSAAFICDMLPSGVLSRWGLVLEWEVCIHRGMQTLLWLKVCEERKDRGQHSSPSTSHIPSPLSATNHSEDRSSGLIRLSRHPRLLLQSG